MEELVKVLQKQNETLNKTLKEVIAATKASTEKGSKLVINRAEIFMISHV